MDQFLKFWPLVLAAILSGVWLIRLEGLQKIGDQRSADRAKASEDKSDARYNEIMRLLAEHYATKNEVSMLKGAIDTLSPQLADTKSSVLRIEGKVDAFLVAAVQQGSSQKSLRRE